MLANIRIVLVCPAHPGNVGAVARAMKNMGLSDLFLVSPEEFPSREATARAVGAADVLNQAVVVTDLASAVLGCHWVYGTSARERALEKPTVFLRECAEESVRYAQKIAILFGRENAGLTNEELSICHKQIVIPTSETFSSLNLAAAVQLVAYEFHMAAMSSENKTTYSPVLRELATAEQVLGFYQHLEKTLIDIQFLDTEQPRFLMQRLRRLFNRASLDAVEINLLRGILSQMDWVVARK